MRSASRVTFTPGKCMFKKLPPLYAARTRIYFGYPEPSGSWEPGRHLNWKINFPDGSYTDSIPLVVSVSTNTVNRLKTELMVKVGDRKVSYGEALAESRQTISMIARAAIKLFQAYKAARALKWAKVAKILGVSRVGLPKGATFAQGWLAYHFGWLPLASDIHASAVIAQDGLRKKDQILSATRVITVTANPGGSHDTWSEVNRSGTLRNVGKVYFKLSDSHLAYANQVGFINPLEVAWALVPASFIVDWFLPINNFLEAFSARAGLTFLGGYTGHYAEVSLRLGGLTRQILGWEQVFAEGSVTGVGMVYRREPLGSFPMPAIYWKSPLSSTHSAHAIALYSTLKR